MTTPGQNQPPAPSGQAVPAPQNSNDDGGGGGFGQWLEDTYNGLYVIVLKPRMPEGILYGMGILGVLLGILWAYVVFPTTFAGANPNRLDEGAQRQWLLMTAVGADADNLYETEQLIALAQAIPNPRATITEMLRDPNISEADQQALNTLLNRLPTTIDESPETAQAITGPSILITILMGFIVPIIVVIVVVVIATLLWRFFIYDNFVAPLKQWYKEQTNPEEKQRAEDRRKEIKILQEQRRLREELAKENSGSELGDPVMTQLAIYTPGRMFDESYEIELESGEFLGQSGAVIAESVDPDPVAIEVWLFDMHSSRNIAKVFMTPQASNDPSIRSRIEADVDNPQTDIIVANPGSTLTIDTDKIRLEAKFANLDINANGRFENFNMQMRAWNKDGASASAPAAPPIPTPATPAAPAGAPDMSVYDDIQFDAPPPMPSSGGSSGAPDMSVYDNIQFDDPPPMPSSSGSSGAPDMSVYDNIQFDDPPPMPSSGSNPPPSSGMTPLQPPPLSYGNDDDGDDDPFGGTGDFTPLGGR